MLTVTYYYSACVGIRSDDVGVLCDPWFTEGAFDGSWYHYPPFPDAIERVPAYDLIYVSHLHPDHYDASFLRAYLTRHPSAKVVIADFERNLLSRVMTRDGIAHQVSSRLSIGATELALFPRAENEHDVDSALAVKRGGDSVVNMNDNLFEQQQIDAIHAFLGGSRPTIALLGYTNSGPYPHTFFEDPAVLLEKARESKETFFDRYRQMRAALDPAVAIPFAGKYILGGRLHQLNKYRSTADAVEVCAFDDAAVVLADGGNAQIDTESLKPTAVRTEPYSTHAIAVYAETLADRPMQWETFLSGLPVHAIPFARLLPKAYEHAHARSSCKEPYYFCIRVADSWFVANAYREEAGCFFTRNVELIEPRTEIHIDHRYLFGLITGVFHWNNAAIGSQYRARRVPDAFSRGALTFLYYLHV